MSKKIAVLSHTQASSARALIHVKREVAALLLARLFAESITCNCIRMLPPGSPSLKALEVTGPPSIYIPEEMPLSEVDNLRFQVPQSDDWKRCHLPARSQLQGVARRKANEWAAESMPARIQTIRLPGKRGRVSDPIKSFNALSEILTQVR